LTFARPSSPRASTGSEPFGSPDLGGYALNVVHIPRLRFLGFLLVAVGVVSHNTIFLQRFSIEETVLVVAVFGSYATLSWLMIYLFFERSRWFDVAGFFVVFDILMLALAVYLSGGERSMLFFLMVMRVVDQAHTNVRRLMLFTHVSMLSYVGLMVYLDVFEGRTISWAMEGMKLFFLSAVCIYVMLTSERALKNRSLRVFRLTKQLHEKTRQLEEANRAKSAFLANMSHELRTPLNSIIGFANFVLKRRRRDLTEDDRSYLERIVANGKHLLRLISDILDFTRVETARLEPVREPLSVEKLVRETVDQFGEGAEEGNVPVMIDVAPNLRPVETDELMLKQVLINLLSNALKFTREGSVTVRVRTGERADTPIGIDVIDTGIGIPRERQGAIFEAFQQVEGGMSRLYGGAGLGLAISKSLCELMGYRLNVESEVGRGSTFSILFSS
jgi:signal transduction histidine kinase